MKKKAMELIGLIIFGLASARIGLGFQWESNYGPQVLHPGSSLTLRWSYTLTDGERKQANDFSLVIIEKEREVFSNEWQGLAVKIPFSGVYKQVSQFSNFYLIRDKGAGLIFYNATGQGITRYRCTFLSGFSAPKQLIMPIVKETIVRLVDGRPPLSGRVEIFHDGQWGEVCEFRDQWAFSGAQVICRMLGYPTAVGSFDYNYKRNEKIWLGGVQCQGNERSITQCYHRPWGVQNCTNYNYNKYAGVMCLSATTYSPYLTTRRPYYTTRWPYYTTRRPYTSPGYNAVRLVGGNLSSMGRVEILHNGQWGTICDDEWDINDARVVCRMLGYPSAYRAVGRAYFGNGSGRIWLDNVQCYGYERTISYCRHRPWGIHDCGHNEDAGVICTWNPWTPHTTWRPTYRPTIGNIGIRLAGNGSSSSMGRVEIYYRGEWGTICDDRWDLNDARVVCRMLGYSGANSTPGTSTFGIGRGRIWLDEVNCIGSESSITQCNHDSWGVHNCRHREDAGVMCEGQGPGNNSLRLVGIGNSSFMGRVEIYYRGEWGTICDDRWDVNDAHVVCRMLGFDSALRAVGSAHFGVGSGRIWLDDVECTGNESYISQCRHSLWGQHNCKHYEDAGVICESKEPSSIQNISPTLNVKRGVDVYLYCSATGGANTTVEWIRNNKSLASGTSRATYIIKNIQFYNAGVYRCIASNKYGSDSNTTMVYVLQSPMNTFANFNVSKSAAMIGEIVMVTCETEANPPATCELYRYGNRLGGSGYIILGINSSDFGPYSCKCSNSLGIGSGTGTITLYEHPNIQTILPSTQDINETDSFKIFCNATGNPLPKISWYKPKENKRPVGFGKTIFVPKSSLGDEGTYICTADNGRYQATANATVNLIYRVPRISNPPTNTTVAEDYNRRYYLYCNVTGNPKPGVKWYKVGMLDRNPIGYGEQLTLHARWDYSGIYECVAENGIGGAARARAFYQILHKPYSTQLKTNRDNNVVLGNAAINIICTTVANPPADQYSIYRGNEHVTTSSSGLYNISKAKANDQGTYTCYPRNSIGSGVNASMELHVFGALSIISAPKNTTVIEGQKATLYCNASSSLYKVHLPAIIRWKKVGEIDQHLPDGKILVVEDCQPKDAGVYECEARNGIALPDVARATVIVQHKPRDTTLALSTGGVSIYLNATISFICNSTAVPPVSNSIFYHKGVKIGESSNGVFNISRVSASDIGKYSCVSKNYIGEGPRASITLKFTKCGVRGNLGNSAQTRIIGGDDSKHGGWPWQVQMAFTSHGTFYSHWCGASIINDTWIVTAAHCVTRRLFGSIYIVTTPESLNITLGEYNRSRIDGTEQEIPVETIIVHSNYSMTTTDYDIALLKLRHPMTFNEHVSPVCLPQFDFPPNTACYITGWGRTTMAHYRSSIVLQEAVVPLMDRALCKRLLLRIGQVTSRMRCNGYNRYPKSTCHGDSGGPLVCERDGIWYLMGITSWGSRNCADMRYPSVYADVLYFKNWILKTIELNS